MRHLQDEPPQYWIPSVSLRGCSTVSISQQFLQERVKPSVHQEQFRDPLSLVVHQLTANVQCSAFRRFGENKQLISDRQFALASV